jgi:NAD(P)-dependent dehydrogenase (short-subunit alcohol dehydrogenase family)
MPFHSSIAASKAAVEGLAKSLAAEYATKIRFNVIAPTVTDTELAKRLLRTEKQQESIALRHPLKKYLQPKEVASLAAYLLSNQSTAISGQVFPIDAGITTLKL